MCILLTYICVRIELAEIVWPLSTTANLNYIVNQMYSVWVMASQNSGSSIHCHTNPMDWRCIQ